MSAIKDFRHYFCSRCAKNTKHRWIMAKWRYACVRCGLGL